MVLPSRSQLIRDSALTKTDLLEIATCRGEPQRLGFAYQLGFVRLFQRFPVQQPLEICEELQSFIALQTGIDAGQLSDYASWQQTVSRHQIRIREYLGLRTFDSDQARGLEQFLYEESCRLEQTAALLGRAREYLKQESTLFPAESVLTRIIGEQRRKAREAIAIKVAEELPRHVSQALDKLLEVAASETVSGLRWIKKNPAKPSTAAMRLLAEKLEVIEATGVLGIDLEWLNSNYQRALFHYVRKCSAHRLRELARPRRRAALVCFLRQSYRDAVDQAVDMFDKLLTRTVAHAEREMDQHLREQRRTIRSALLSLRSVGKLILDDTITDAALRQRVFQTVSRQELSAQMEQLSDWVTGSKSDVFHGVIKRFSYLRQFSPVLLRTLEFFPDSEDAKLSCWPAVQLLRDLNDKQKRKLPKDVPIDFVPKRLLPLVVNGGSPDRRAWECAVLLKLREELRSGNLAVRHSKRFGQLKDYFISDQQWGESRDLFFLRSGLPADPNQVPSYLKARLNKAYDLFLRTAPQNKYATAKDDRWRLSVDPSERLAPDAEAQLHRLKGWLARQMPTIRLPDLLIEVDNELRFTNHFLAPDQRSDRKADDVCLQLATVLAHGCNIGLHTMAQLTPGISYKQLKRVSDWQLTEEAQRQALAEMVRAISRLDATLHWGEGRTSASDGQRFAMPHKVLQQTFSTRFSDYALEFYSFIADNYAPFYSTPIECTDRDAAFVLDGLLYNESDLELEEHYTDTHGYTEINFAAFAMLGRRFCPRIRSVQHQRLYRIDRDRDYGILTDLVARADHTIDIEVIQGQWERMGQFYSSLATGHTTASVALQRLVACPAKNLFYRANRDLGRVFKTEFLLSYLSEPQLRSRIRRGLLKVEQLHALARDVYYGRRGRINARELHEQMNSCSCLTLILACIIYWQAKQITRTMLSGDLAQEGIDATLIQHISPIEWDNVILYGQAFLGDSLRSPRPSDLLACQLASRREDHGRVSIIMSVLIDVS